ncbi:hypothetical protein [Streptomyces naganishii]|nr:hypothetical protein [Streptomyces naganishii]
MTTRPHAWCRAQEDEKALASGDNGFTVSLGCLLDGCADHGSYVQERT